MLKPENNDRTILDFAQGGYLSIAVDSFITDRRGSELTKHSIKFYQSYLKAFLDYCDSLAGQRRSNKSILTLSENIYFSSKENGTRVPFMVPSEPNAHSSVGWILKK